MKNFKSWLLTAWFSTIPALPFTLEGIPGTLFTPSAQPLEHLSLAVGVSGFGHNDASTVKYHHFVLHVPGDLDTSIIQDLESGTARLNLGLGLGPHFDLVLSLPFHGDYIGDTKAKDVSGAGLGDPKLHIKASHTLLGRHVLDVAFLGAVSVPSKTPKGFLAKQEGYVHVYSDSAGENERFFSAYGPVGEARMLWTFDPSKTEAQIPFRAHLGYGLQTINATGARPQFLLGGALEWLPQPTLGFFADIQTESRFSRLKGFQDIGKDHALLGGGFSVVGDEGLFFTAGFQKSLSHRTFRNYAKSGVGEEGVWRFQARTLPNFAFGINIGWRGSLVPDDSDHDGVPDLNDPCPHEMEDEDKFQDGDGCPENDNDQDSVVDAKDKCPLEAEDRDAFQDEDGCPEPDNDQDQVKDGEDKCPLEVEDFDGFEDYDGCPDLDNDQDGVTDPQDKCVAMAEDMDGFEDGDGCPEPDNDQDKIPDLSDKCPNEAENVNGFEDGDGCPDLTQSPLGSPMQKRTLLRGVRFRGSTTDLLPEAYAALDSLADRLKSGPAVVVEIRAYMDNAGKEPEMLRISEARASAIRNYLISRSVSAGQLSIRGMGSKDPIATNRTAAGRAQNRRIEIFKVGE